VARVPSPATPTPNRAPRANARHIRSDAHSHLAERVPARGRGQGVFPRGFVDNGLLPPPTFSSLSARKADRRMTGTRRSGVYGGDGSRLCDLPA